MFRNLKQGGFTLIELMIVVAIIGVLASIAVPQYQNYVGRAQAAEAFTATAGIRTDIAVYYAENGSFSATLLLAKAITSTEVLLVSLMASILEKFH